MNKPWVDTPFYKNDNVTSFSILMRDKIKCCPTYNFGLTLKYVYTLKPPVKYFQRTKLALLYKEKKLRSSYVRF